MPDTTYGPVDAAPLTPTEALILQRQIKAVHALGPRPLYELMVEILRDVGPVRAHWITARVGTYAALDPAAIRAVGGDAIPLPPLAAVR